MTVLDGVRVVDFTQALSGPYCTLMLADLGADVVKVEAPGRGDDARHWGPPFVGPDAAYFVAVNRNKRSAALDLKSPADREHLDRLIGRADVVVENWRPGTASRLGLGAEQLRRADPRLIYCSISGYGQDGPPLAGYDQIVQGTSGVMSLTGPAGSPTKWGVPSADICAGMFAAGSVLAALYERQRTGTGRTIDISMQDSLVSMLTHQAARHLATGRPVPNDGNNHSAIVPYGLFASADGFVNVCVGNDAQFARLCEALGLTAAIGGFRTNPQRLAAREEVLSVVGAAIGSLGSQEVTERLQQAGVPVGPVRDLGEVFDDPETARRGMVLSVTSAGGPPTGVVNTPFRFDGHPPAAHRPPPRLGEHTSEIISETGRSGESAT
nr:CoA transferase [Kineosporia rhizophila]